MPRLRNATLTYPAEIGWDGQQDAVSCSEMLRDAARRFRCRGSQHQIPLSENSMSTDDALQAWLRSTCIGTCCLRELKSRFHPPRWFVLVVPLVTHHACGVQTACERHANRCYSSLRRFDARPFALSGGGLLVLPCVRESGPLGLLETTWRD